MEIWKRKRMFFFFLSVFMSWHLRTLQAKNELHIRTSEQKNPKEVISNDPWTLMLNDYTGVVVRNSCFNSYGNF